MNMALSFISKFREELMGGSHAYGGMVSYAFDINNGISCRHCILASYILYF